MSTQDPQEALFVEHPKSSQKIATKIDLPQALNMKQKMDITNFKMLLVVYVFAK